MIIPSIIPSVQGAKKKLINICRLNMKTSLGYASPQFIPESNQDASKSDQFVTFEVGSANTEE